MTENLALPTAVSTNDKNTQYVIILNTNDKFLLICLCKFKKHEANLLTTEYSGSQIEMLL